MAKKIHKERQLTSKQRAFCEALARGCNQSQAYREAYGCLNARADSVKSNASKLLTNNNVLIYLNELREANTRDTIATAQELLEFHTANIRTPIGDVGRNSPLCQSYKETEEGYSYTMPSKIESAREICRMKGFYAADKVKAEVTGKDGAPLIMPALDISQADVLAEVARIAGEAQAKVIARSEGLKADD